MTVEIWNYMAKEVSIRKLLLKFPLKIRSLDVMCGGIDYSGY